MRSNAPAVSFRFSGDKWKDRDEAAEKVFINEQERKLWDYSGHTIKKLLEKVEKEEEEWIQNNSKFEDGLRDILKRHKINNEPFFSEVSNLHKMLSDWKSFNLSPFLMHSP